MGGGDRVDLIAVPVNFLDLRSVSRDASCGDRTSGQRVAPSNCSSNGGCVETAKSVGSMAELK